MSAAKKKKPRPKKLSALEYVARDVQAMKHTLDEVLRPYKADVKTLRTENESLRQGAARREKEVETLLRFIGGLHPRDGTVDAAIELLLDRKRPGFATFRLNWLRRLGILEA